MKTKIDLRLGLLARSGPFVAATATERLVNAGSGGGLRVTVR
jgi:hypothetical protein